MQVKYHVPSIDDHRYVTSSSSYGDLSEFLKILPDLMSSSNYYVLPDVMSDTVQLQPSDADFKSSSSPHLKFITIQSISAIKLAEPIQISFLFTVEHHCWRVAAFARSKSNPQYHMTGVFILYDDRKFEFLMRLSASSGVMDKDVVNTAAMTLGALGYYLNHHHTECETVERCTSAQNAKRVKKGKKPLPAYTVIRIGEPVSRGSSRTGAGGERCPHDRRGHFRHYKSGRVRWVNAAKIKGGASAPREYRIKE